MSHIISIRLADDLAAWLRTTARQTGLSQARIIQDQLEKARASGRRKGYMRLAGSVKGLPRDLSGRRGFSRS